MKYKRKMVVATHLIKVRGTFDKHIWNEEKIKKYIRRKIIYNIDDSYHTHLELFKVDHRNNDKDDIEIWVYVHCLPSQVDKDIINKWIDNNIKEDGLAVKDFEYEMIVDITNSDWKYKPFINLSWNSFDDMDEEERKLLLENIYKKFEKQMILDNEYKANKKEKRKEEGVKHTYKK